jgi:hypothetical protein
LYEIISICAIIFISILYELNIISLSGFFLIHIQNLFYNPKIEDIKALKNIENISKEEERLKELKLIRYLKGKIVLTHSEEKY